MYTNYSLCLFHECEPTRVAETNKYDNQYLGKIDINNGCLWLPDMTAQEIQVFSAIILKIKHDFKGTLKDYWATLQKLYTPLRSKTIMHSHSLVV
jgi:hypothetical protein